MSLCSKLFSKIPTISSSNATTPIIPIITSSIATFSSLSLSQQKITSLVTTAIQNQFLYTTSRQTTKHSTIVFNVNLIKCSTVTTSSSATASAAEAVALTKTPVTKTPNKYNKQFLNDYYEKFHKINYYQQSSFYSKFTVRDPHHTVIPQGLDTLPLNEDRAYEILLSLDETEFKAIKTALERYEAKKIKEGFEGQLAATRWRSRFGRPAKMPALGDVDPTGSYCAVPVDWVKKKYAERTKPPESKDLWKIFMVNAVPFIGFGFLDNFTMIIAGDYIENIFGAFMCISTMAAAGLGNTISDILGIGSAYYVERFSELLGLRPPNLTPIQLEMKSSRRSANSGRIFGITLGCVIGMFPLLFMDSSNKKQSENDDKNDKTESSKKIVKE